MHAFGSALTVVATIALGIAVWALVRGASPRARIPNRKVAGWVMAGSLAVGATGSSLAPPSAKGRTKVFTSSVAAGVLPAGQPAGSDGEATSAAGGSADSTPDGGAPSGAGGGASSTTTPTTARATTTTAARPTTTTTAGVTTTTAKPTTTTAKPTTTTTRPPTTTTTRRITPTTVPASGGKCDPSYPDVCIPSGPDLNCPDIPYKNFRVVGSDPHGFDSDNDGIGCEKK